ncbi:peptidoglycan DD-metalloendopeptidase family protein [Prevotella sp. AGR2160]|uniref:peptidoglycan DD-metalloendopeptidase family protein n=1 Tax=Prevotella sp. AGR2160 TaxID=1280674 RepID=UPI000425808E|nr:M23 family metallopeptidase [Prevotella sp. AGR2160]
MKQINRKLFYISILLPFFLLVSAFMPARKTFTTAEQQQINIATPGLFRKGPSFTIDLSQLSKNGYSFPLPVGKALQRQDFLEITTSKGDAVKAMFDGTVRLSRKTTQYGNVIVIRHDNGLETVYANNAQNLVDVGDHVRAGQTIAIVGERNDRIYCLFSIMINGSRINPAMLLELRSHQLRQETLICKRTGRNVRLSVSGNTTEESARAAAERHSKGLIVNSLDPDDAGDDPFLTNSTFRLDLQKLEKNHWAYPLPGSHVISPYGGRRNHAGVDIKTRPNDPILAAFDGIVMRSGPYYGYGNCIVIRHAYGFETLYSHQSRNIVKIGQHVKAGQVIGYTGRTGRATTEHLHFEIHFKGRRINPAMLFNHSEKRLQASTLILQSNGSVKKM